MGNDLKRGPVGHSLFVSPGIIDKNEYEFFLGGTQNGWVPFNNSIECSMR